MSVPPDGQAVLTIDLDALAGNWRVLAGRAAPAECGAVVKADAYGIGIERAVPALARAGCRTFFTAHVSEGARARASLRQAGFGDATARVFILNGFHPTAVATDLFHGASLSPVIGSAAELDAFAAARRQGRPLRCALHVDTGMNRLGFDPDEALGLDQDRLAAAGIDVVMSHFVSAEEPDNPVNAKQIERFDQLRQGLLQSYPASLANSSGLFLESRPIYALARPGYALYGGNPTPGRPNPMQPVVSLSAKILQTRWIEAGESVGYNGRWIAPRRTRAATIGLGYADGFPRNAMTIGHGDGPKALVGGRPCRLIGRVSMDLSIVDVTDAPEGDAEAGCMIELLGPTITVDDLGEQTGTIGYEILTNLGRRYQRVYREACIDAIS
ncbi:alanine racemase [Lichenihabitans psoromatis]|uniref:alanine racemase n=1 Tax=Lichenihabitans psoromatis TaxID=2528642 RepID=UPI0010383FA7|nr:alanine racemase [Lichenihabitans psoromatis]